MKRWATIQEGRLLRARFLQEGGAAMRRAIGLCVVVSAILRPDPAIAESHAEDRWLPSISVGLLAHVQNLEGAAQSTFAARPAFDPSVVGDPLIMIPVIQADAGLMAPEIEVGERTIRPFVHGRVQFPMDPDRTILRDGSLPKPVQIPADPSPTLVADALSGQGTLGIATLDLTGQLGIGLAMDLPVELVPLRLGVSLDYLVERISFDGEVVHVRGEGAGDTQPFVIQRLERMDHDLFHHLGPRIELETLAGERGPLRFTVFAEFGAFFVLNGRTPSFRAADATDTADFTFRVDPWMLQAGVGARIAWVGWK